LQERKQNTIHFSGYDLAIVINPHDMDLAVIIRQIIEK